MCVGGGVSVLCCKCVSMCVCVVSVCVCVCGKCGVL